VITGVYEPSEGDVRFAAQPGSAESIAGRPPHVIARLGVARTFQTLRLFMNMSVLENVMAATYGGTKAMPWESVLRLPRARREEREARALAEDVLSFFGQRLAGYRWDQPAYSLSYANRRRLEIARALATKPKLLLLDEPAAGLNSVESRRLVGLIKMIRDSGITILLVEHHMNVVMPTCDRITVLNYGRRLADGAPGDIRKHPEVIKAYLGKGSRRQRAADLAPEEVLRAAS
jgi:branched-chain amino acid transport system ATP-binding protein